MSETIRQQPVFQARASHAEASARDRALAALLAAAFGLVVVFATGFAPSEAVHNAAHDSRHSFAFPCH